MFRRSCHKTEWTLGTGTETIIYLKAKSFQLLIQFFDSLNIKKVLKYVQGYSQWWSNYFEVTSGVKIQILLLKYYSDKSKSCSVKL